MQDKAPYTYHFKPAWFGKISQSKKYVMQAKLE